MNEDLKKAKQVLESGGTILYPTDTIWGIGCDATNPAAVEKVFKIKQRTDSKSLIVLMDLMARLERFVQEVPDVAYDLLEVTDKPLTLIYPKGKNLALNVLADDGSVGIRLIEERFCYNLIQRFKRPIVSSSANISGQPSPVNFGQISDEIKTQVDYIVEYRQDDILKTQASPIIQLGVGGEIKIIRK